MSRDIRLGPGDLTSTTVIVGKVTLYFFRATLVAFECPNLGKVRNPEAALIGGARLLGQLGFNTADTAKTLSEEDFQLVALGAVQGSTGPAHLLKSIDAG